MSRKNSGNFAPMLSTLRLSAAGTVMKQLQTQVIPSPQPSRVGPDANLLDSLVEAELEGIKGVMEIKKHNISNGAPGNIYSSLLTKLSRSIVKLQASRP